MPRQCHFYRWRSRRKIYKVGWRPVWAVDPPDDSAFPPLLVRKGPAQSRSQGTVLQWNALSWEEKIAGKIQEGNIGRESKTVTSWKLVRIPERSVVRMSKREIDIRPQLVDTLDICVDLDALSKHASLYLRREIVYSVTERKKILTKDNKWKVKLHKKERRLKLRQSL